MVTSLMLLSMSHQTKSMAFGASVMMLATAAFATFRYATTTRLLSEKLKSKS